MKAMKAMKAMKGMGTKLTLGILIIIIIAAAGIYLQYGYQGEPLTEPQVKDIVKDRYPGVADDDISASHQDNCTVCDESGCTVIEDCWTANFTEGGMIHSIILDGGSGGIVGDEQNPCTEWWCDAVDCVYFYREIIPNGSKSYYNTGCGGSTPVCDEGYEKCRECWTTDECVSKTITSMAIPEETVYRYDVIETGSWGTINDTAYYCEVYDDGGRVFYNQTTIEECETIIEHWSRCYGVCDFEPEYGLIPY